MGFDWTIWSKVIIQTIFNDHGSPTWFWLVLTRINLRLIKCDFLLDFILFHLKKKSIPNQLEFWAASYGQNKKHVQKITQISVIFNFLSKFHMGINIKSVQAYLIDLSFPFASEESFFFWKINWIEKQIHPVKKLKNSQKMLLFSAAIWNAFLAQKKLKFSFLNFWISSR